jgi:hypothetical protein
VKISRKRGRLLLHLEPAEVSLMVALLDEMAALLAADADPDDEVLRRLHPDAYSDDAQAQAEYRTLTESSLRTQRNERIETCRAELAGSDGVDLTDPEAAQRWIQVLNDLRLALGTRLGITEDDDHNIDPGGIDAQPRLIYYWLTAVQDSVVQQLMR